MNAVNNFINLNDAEAFSSNNSDGCVTIINVPTSKRIKFSKKLMEELGNPTSIEIFFIEQTMIVLAARDNVKNPISFSSGGIIYNGQLAEKIMSRSSAEFPEGKSVRVGSYEMQSVDENTQAAVISFE